MLQFPGIFELSAIGVDVGYDAPGAVFTRNHRIKTLRIVFSNGEEVTLDFKDERGIQLIPLARAPGPPITADTIRVYIEEVYPGSYYDDTCLGEIEIWGIVP